jgi:multiple sugar transport system permease protein
VSRVKFAKHLKFGLPLALLMFFFLFPFFWLAEISIKTRIDAQDPSTIFSFTPTLASYDTAIYGWKIPTFMLNSLLASGLSVILSLALAIPASYGMSRIMGKGGTSLSLWFLSLRFFPSVLTALAYFFISREIMIYDTIWVLVVAYMMFSVPFAVWIVKGFFDAIPRDYEEAAEIDGCTRFSAFRKICLPLVAGGAAVTAVLCFIQCWNEFTFAFFLTSTNVRTASAALAGNFLAEGFGVRWGEMAASSILVSMPLVLFAWVVQKYVPRILIMSK